MDGSSKTLMVDERQTVRDVMDNLFEKTHCDCNVDWSVCETNPDLQTGEYHPGTHRPACPFSCHQLYKAGFREDDEVCFYWRADSQAPVSSQYRADLPLYTFTLIHQTTGGFNLLPQTPSLNLPIMRKYSPYDRNPQFLFLHLLRGFICSYYHMFAFWLPNFR